MNPLTAPTCTASSTESMTMATLKYSAQRAILTGAAALAVAAGPLLAWTTTATPATVLAACPAGETVNPVTGECQPNAVAVPGSGVHQGGVITESTPGDPNSLPEVMGIPCTGANTGQCIGLQEVQQPPEVQPRSEISSSP